MRMHHYLCADNWQLTLHVLAYVNTTIHYQSNKSSMAWATSEHTVIEPWNEKTNELNVKSEEKEFKKEDQSTRHS